MEKAVVEMINLQNKMLLDSVGKLPDMIDGCIYFTNENKNMAHDHGGSELYPLWEDYDLALNALRRALSHVNYANELIEDAQKKLEKKLERRK